MRQLGGGRPALACLVACCASAFLPGCQGAPKPEPQTRVALIQPPKTCADVVFPVYFEVGSARLTREAARLVAAAHDSARSCDVHGIVVKGLASGSGGANANLALSKRRADAVTKALSKAGFSAIQFEVTALSEAEPGAGLPSGRDLRRRVEVRIHLVDHPASPGA